MKSKVFTLLFALPFFGVGVWMAYSVGSSVYDSWQMQPWLSVDGQLQNAGYESHSGDDSTTYEAYAQYSYEFEGQTHHNDRVGLSSGADNIGDYQTDMGNELRAKMSRGESVDVYVNPLNPADSILDRNLRWGLLGFKSIFLFVFGGVGLGLIIVALKSSKEKDTSLPMYQDAPWLANDDWQTGEIRSSSKATMWAAWAFAGVWNLISAPLAFMIYGEVLEKKNYLALAGLLFPIVGVGLLVWALRATREWTRFGRAPVTLDPFPGSIGGHAGGTIEIGLPYDSTNQFEVTLTCVYSYISGSGKNRSRTESAKWQESQVAHASVGGKGTRLLFRFDIPKELHESDAQPKGETYYLWRLSLKADLEGADFNRDYEIPVYQTGQESRALAEFSVQKAQDKQAGLDDKAVEKLVRIGFGDTGRTMLFPAGRNLGSGFGGLLFGVVFAGVGGFLAVKEGHWFMGGIFTFVGGLILLFSIYSVLNSLEIIRDGMHIRTIRRFLGFPVRRHEMLHSEFRRFEKASRSQTRSGKKHVMHYSVYAVDRSGRKIVVGEGFNGANQAKAAMRMIAREFGLRPEKSAVPERTAVEDFDFLATDS